MDNINNIFFWALLGLIYIQWHYFWMPLLLDNFRSRLFETRDKLFDLALEGTFAFSNEAYQEMRNRINCVLRFAHRTNLTNFLVMAFFQKDLKDFISVNEKSFDEKISDLDDSKAKGKIKEIKREVNFAIGKYFLFSSPFVLILVLLATIIRIISKVIHAIKIKEILKPLRNKNIKNRLFIKIRKSTTETLNDEIRWVNLNLRKQIELETVLEKERIDKNTAVMA
jgi:hypothetical protein